MPAAPLRLPLPPHFSFREALWFLDRKYDDCVHRVGPGWVRKAVRCGSRTGLLEVRADARHLHVDRLHGDLTDADAATYVRTWFDLDRDLAPFYTCLRQVPALSPLADAFAGLRLLRLPDLLEALGWSIIGQQINLRFAYTLKRRLVEAYGSAIYYQGSAYWLFPAPDVLAALAPEALLPLQFSRSKARYLTATARALADGTLHPATLADLPLPDAYRQLTALPGIGPWTANYVLLKSLGHTGAVPHGDAGLIRAVRLLLGLDRNPTQAETDALLAPLGPWAGYGVIYLWRTLAPPPDLDTAAR